MLIALTQAYNNAPTLLRHSIAALIATVFLASLLVPLTAVKADELATTPVVAPAATPDQLIVKPSEALAAIKKIDGLLADSSQVKTTNTTDVALQSTTSLTADDGSSSVSTLTIPRGPTETVRLDATTNTVTTTPPETVVNPETGETTQIDPTALPTTTTSTTNNTVLLTLPNGTDAAGGRTIANGLVTYAGANGSANAVQATNDGGMRMITIIDTAAAPTSYAYGVSVPTGGKVVVTEDGSATIQDNGGNVITNIGMPWAKDDKGQIIPTRFTTDGVTLIQTVDHTIAGITYPVVADPWWDWGAAYRMAKCEAVTLAAIGGVYLAAVKIKKLGGLRAVVSSLKETQSAGQLAHGALAIGATVSGAEAIVLSCKNIWR